jgi:hypothetical protein
MTDKSQPPLNPDGQPNYRPDWRMILVIILLVGLGVVMALTYEALFGGG